MVGQIILNNDGFGYKTAPSVIIEDPPIVLNSRVAKAVAITTSVSNVRSIYQIRITDPGQGYNPSNPPKVTITGGGGAGAEAIAHIVDNGLSAINVIDSGNGYFDNPEVIISGPSIGTTATAEVISSSGRITSIELTNTGSGYNSPPSVNILGISTTGTGTFVYNELITGQTSGTQARLKDFRTIISSFPGVPPELRVKVALNTGKFSPGEVIVGSSSSARYYVKSYETDSYDNQYDTNEEIELEADSILDFTESNPFGDY